MIVDNDKKSAFFNYFIKRILTIFSCTVRILSATALTVPENGI
jgi:hypothetical protein